LKERLEDDIKNIIANTEEKLKKYNLILKDFSCCFHGDVWSVSEVSLLVFNLLNRNELF